MADEYSGAVAVGAVAVGAVAVGAVAVGAVAGLVGGNADTDCACAVAATPANNPKPRTVDLSKLDIPCSPIIVTH